MRHNHIFKILSNLILLVVIPIGQVTAVSKNSAVEMDFPSTSSANMKIVSATNNQQIESITVNSLKGNVASVSKPFQTLFNENLLGLTWNTFLGSVQYDDISDIVVDGNGNIYIVGTSSATWGTPLNPFAGTGGSGIGDAFVAKLNDSGVLQWLIFLGGEGDDYAREIALDKTGNIYITGSSYGDWGTPIVHNDWLPFYPNSFLAKLNSDGALQWSTFLGVSGGGGVAIDGNGYIYVAGNNYNASGGPPGSNKIIKLNDNGSILWSSFLENSSSASNGIIVGDDGNIYIAGHSWNTWGIPINSFAADVDAFVAKLDNNGVVQWNTFFGGSGYDYGFDIALDSGGNVYLTGQAGGSAFAAKFTSGGVLQWNTLFGPGSGWGAGIELDGSGNIYVTGNSYWTWGTPINAFAGGDDTFIAKLSGSGTLQSNTFLGGESTDYGNGIALDGSENIYVVGNSATTWGFPIDPYAGLSDAFVAKVPAASLIARPPVILVHGWQGLAFESGGYHCGDGIQRYNGINSTLIANSKLAGYTHIAQWLEEDGYQVWIAHLESNPIYTATLEQNAKCLQKQIEWVWDQNPQSITIIGHSMGGVVSRATLNYLPPEIKVKSLYTLGSPNAGLPTDIFKLFPLTVLNCIQQRGMCNMSIEGMNRISFNPLIGFIPFNQKYLNLENVQYNFFGGDGGSGILWGLLYANLQGPNDGLVGRYSTVGWSYPFQSFGLFNWASKSIPGQYFTGETHPANSDKSLAYYVAPQGQKGESYMCIRDLMKNQTNSPNCQSIKAQSLQANSAEVNLLASNSYSFTESKTGHLEIGEGTSLPLTIDSTGKTVLYLNWNKGTAPIFTLTRPDAVVINPQYALDNPTLATYETTDGTPESAPYQAYSFADGQVGVWQLNIIASTDPIDFQAFGIMDNSIRTLTAQADKDTYAIGDTSFITAVLNSASLALVGATVNAKITSPDAVETLLPLTDNLDGTYTGSYSIPDAPGYLTIDITASGNDGGVPYTRNTNLINTIAPNDLQPTGTYSDQPRDDDADMFYDYLDFTAEVNLTAPGEYAVSAELYSGDQLITQSGDFFPLIAGTQTITLSFDGREINKAGLDGPYTVKNLYLTPIDVGITAQSVETAWTTGAYSFTQFVDGVSPMVSSITRVSASPASAESIDFTVTFFEPVTGADAIGPLSDFGLTTSPGITGAFVSSLTPISETTYTVSVNTGSGNGTIRLDVADNNSILDAASNPLGGAALGDGDFTNGQIYTIIKTATFADVPLSYWSNSYIERLYNAGITGGCSAIPLNYCPTTPVTRAQMAIFLLRGMHGSAFTPPAATGTVFTDVPLGTFGAAWIEELATEGITSGCGGGHYCPTQTVSRAQMAIFLVRAKHGVAFVPPTATGIFPDVPIGSFGANYIEQLVADAITSGCGGGLYCPNTMVKRDSMAVFLVKTFNLP